GTLPPGARALFGDELFAGGRQHFARSQSGEQGCSGRQKSGRGPESRILRSRSESRAGGGQDRRRHVAPCTRSGARACVPRARAALPFGTVTRLRQWEGRARAPEARDLATGFTASIARPRRSLKPARTRRGSISLTNP